MPDPSSLTIYRLQLGAYAEEKNAMAVHTRLTAAGFSPYYEWHNGCWRVILTGIRAAEVRDISWRLRAAGFSEALLREER
jgi:cell division protein FtsN